MWEKIFNVDSWEDVFGIWMYAFSIAARMSDITSFSFLLFGIDVKSLGGLVLGWILSIKFPCLPFFFFFTGFSFLAHLYIFLASSLHFTSWMVPYVFILYLPINITSLYFFKLKFLKLCMIMFVSALI